MSIGVGLVLSECFVHQHPVNYDVSFFVWYPALGMSACVYMNVYNYVCMCVLRVTERERRVEQWCESCAVCIILCFVHHHQPVKLFVYLKEI